MRGAGGEGGRRAGLSCAPPAPSLALVSRFSRVAVSPAREAGVTGLAGGDAEEEGELAPPSACVDNTNNKTGFETVGTVSRFGGHPANIKCML